MRVLHLGFEDPAMPGAGGGSVRTHEINRRLVQRGHEITVLTTRFPGCVDRVQDGVRYLHVGAGKGGNKWTRLLGYVQGLPAAARRQPADLVVEDFFAPFSSMAAPRWTGRPTLGMVQWLHAGDKSRQYKLPLHLLERVGVRSHRRLVAVSHGTAEQLRALNPAARVEVIGNGVEPAAFAGDQQAGRDVVFIGRLELGGKGLDLLLGAWAAVHRFVDGDLVIAGGGPDSDRVRREVARLGLDGRVRFAGWVSGAAKWRLLGGARVVVVPSRHETFGMVALEAMAAATPVVAFDIPGLREVVPAGSGWRVPPFDVVALAERIRAVCADPAVATAAGASGRRFAAGFDWDVLADRQDEVYRSVLEEAVR
ncbi:glycosyltransferase family 4 protein [Pseudonocardia humida]|uniref:Glycosyltransferase family 4 protein n=1 Tax=Pseudonocardia humida TaxID=2800819 RepID=A0ABT1AB61_9PSEU|nr:glycosyltransferase family 4 protein [Pseudonocardia humida]MCO1660270.1 glycosyltransferase family 4 protein [Pseudonocardia humida]